jgi:hypothetical protein
MFKKALLIFPLFLLLLSGCTSKGEIKDDFCGVHINYQYCKCAFHNEYCGNIGMSKGEAKNYVYSEYAKWKEKIKESEKRKKCFTDNGYFVDGKCTKCKRDEEVQSNQCVAIGENDEEDEEQEGEATCKFDSDCDPICEGDIKWKMGCNPRENTCVKTFDTDCSSEQDVFGNLSFSKTCKFGVCVSNEDAINEKKEELEEIKREMSNELKSLNATRDDLKNVMMDANKNCINGLADMTNVAILEFSTRIASLAAGGLPGLADVAVDYVSDAINKLSAYVNAPEESAEEVLKPHEYIKLNCDLYHHFIASLAATDKELEDILEKANQADAELKLLP